MRRVTRPWIIAIVAVLVVAIVGGVWLVGSNRSGGKTSADDLMADIDATPHDPSAVGDLTTVSVADFATKLLQLVADDNNCLVSPLSLELALAMVANGAAGQTQAQILAMLAGDASMDQLNAFFSDYVAGLPNTDNVKVNIANSIWYQQGYAADVLPSFLQANATWFGASAYSVPFSGQTIKDMNAWVDQQTDHMIPNMIDHLDPGVVMVLLNALAFDATWTKPYEQPYVTPGIFTAADGAKQDVTYMASSEGRYLDDGLATGFMKSYGDDDAYDFVALLPNEGVSMQSYLKSLTGAGFLHTLQSVQHDGVSASLPQFSFSYSIELPKALQAMGMTNAFTAYAADFSNMFTNSAGLYIDDVLQKTFIDVTPVGTRAGAATEVSVAYGAAVGAVPSKIVNLDRPFVMAIVDGATQLPLFLGVVNSIS